MIATVCVRQGLNSCAQRERGTDAVLLSDSSMPYPKVSLVSVCTDTNLADSQGWTSFAMARPPR